MESKTFLDFLPTKFRHEKSYFIQNNLTDFEKLSNLSDQDINAVSYTHLTLPTSRSV